MLVVLLFLITACVAEVVPLFSCWFERLAPQHRTRHLVLGYNNTGTGDRLLPFTGGVPNALQPFVGLQPDIFKRGLFPFELVLNDVEAALVAGISWQLDATQLRIGATSLTPAKQCSVAFNNTCPTDIDHFCEDGAYCNGVETCFSLAFLGGLGGGRTVGRCKRSADPVFCPQPTRCNESALACVTPATGEPLPAPSFIAVHPFLQCWWRAATPSGNATLHLAFGYTSNATMTVSRPVTLGDALVARRNTLLPIAYNHQQIDLFRAGTHRMAFVLRDTLGVLGTGQPTARIAWLLTDAQLLVTVADLGATNQCVPETDPPPPPSAGEGGEVAVRATCSQQQPDCSAYDTFCHGPTHCDVATGLCVLDEPSHSPCEPSTRAVHTECLDFGICVSAAAACQTDADCGDGLLCNGAELCVNGSCLGAQNFSIIGLCGTAQAVCAEGVGCVATEESISNGLLALIVLCVIVGVGLFAGAIVLAIRREPVPTPTKKKKKVKRTR